MVTQVRSRLGHAACVARGADTAAFAGEGDQEVVTNTLDRLKAIMHLKELGFTLAEIALLLSDRDNGELDAQAMVRLAGDVLSKIDERIAGLQVIRSYVAPVAVGDLSVLQDEDCNFVFEFMTALSAQKPKRRA